MDPELTEAQPVAPAAPAAPEPAAAPAAPAAPAVPDTSAPPEPSPAAPTPVEDVFANAFSEFSADSKPAAAKPADPAPKPAEPTPKPAEGVAPTPATPVPAPVSAPAPAAPPADHVSAADYQALQDRLAALEKPPAPPAAPAPVYNEAENAAIAAYRENWGDVAAGEALVRRAEYHQLLSHVFAEVHKAYGPLLSAVPQLQERTQLQQLQELIPDYDALRAPVLAWIESQPAYMKNALQEVARTGTAEDVADMFTRYRKETGVAAPAVAPAPASAPAPAAPVAQSAPGAALPAAAAAAAAALKPVGSDRPTPTAAVDKNDFESAFKEFAAL